MEQKIAALINNYNIDCYKQYTKVSNYLGGILDESLKNIERFYYSEFWENRFKNRLKEYGYRFNKIELDRIQGMTSELREFTKFKLFDEDSRSKGVSNYNDMIALNINMKDLNDSHINNVIMHEFGHRQYNQKEFAIVVFLNKIVIDSPGLYIKDNEVLNRDDYKYFMNHDEIRLRIIPIVKEMYDNNWTIEESYELSENLKNDSIKDIFTKDYIIHLLKNIL